MYRLSFLSFIRSRSVIIALALFFSAGLVSIFIGKQFLQKQESAIHVVTELQQEQITRNVQYIPDQFGLLMYYLRFAYINKPDPIAALAIGQQDVNTSIQYLTIRGLEGQRYDTDLFNPYNQLTGNFDLSFVILFLFPLLIIAFCFNLISGEKESGTWPLVSIQAIKPISFVLRKLSIRFIVVAGLLLSLLLLAILIIGIPLDNKMLAFSLTSFLYLTVWFAISFFLVCLHRNSSINALMMLSAWVFLCLLAPAMVNSYVTARYPVPEAYDTFIKQRDGYHTKWDKDQDSTMRSFLQHYPQYEGYVWSGPGFNYMWYYAMQQLGDDEAAANSVAARTKLQQRSKSGSFASLFVPSMQTQLQMTDIAGTGLRQHLQYLDSTAVFHENMRLHFYPKIFGNRPVSEENWNQHTPRFYQQAWIIDWARIILSPVLFVLLFFGLGSFLFKRLNRR